MTRKEAIEILDDGAWWSMVDIMLPCDGAANKALHDAVDIAVATLRAQSIKLNRSRWKRCPVCPSDLSVWWYCPFCGRPRIPEAWAELEQRIGGNNGKTD